MEDLRKLGVSTGHPMVIPCPNYPRLYRIESSDDRARRFGLSANEVFALNQAQASNVLTDEEVSTLVLGKKKYMNNFFSKWDRIENFELTSVGIAIGHANTKRIVGEFAELSKWIRG